MFKKIGLCIARLSALSVFVFILCAFGALALFAVIGDSRADEGVPLPPKKPSLETSNVKGKVVQYSLKDFTKALLDYDRPPVPSHKPVMNAASNEGATSTLSAEKVSGTISKGAAKTYEEIFALQSAGKMQQAKKKMAALNDQRLRGHVLYQRYMHPTAYTSSFEELRSWLAVYADHPGADKIYKLAKIKQPASFSGSLKEPEKTRGIARRSEPLMVPARIYSSSKSRTAADQKRAKALEKSIVQLIRHKNPQQALEKLRAKESVNTLDQVERDILRAKIAQHYLHTGNPEQALKLASQSAARSGLHVPTAGWVAGLATWSKGNYKIAAKYFEVTARSPYASGWTKAGGAYWAARAHMKAGNVRRVSGWLERAMAHPRTFYGLIATRALGRDFDFNWQYPAFTKQQHALLRESEIGARAVALVAAGQNHLAEAELLRLKPKTPEMTGALLSYAGYAGLPALSLRLGSAYETSDGLYFDAALYPKGSWKDRDEFKFDPALVHAIMRQESRFDPHAESYSGALGLMQLMPATARHVAGKGLNENLLVDPVYNLELGEKYLKELVGLNSVDGDLLSLLVAYNAGPGNLSKWKRQWASVDDPLLFIELMPSRETRAYVERVLSNYWIYRMRDGQKTPTLNALAQGKVAKHAQAKGQSSGQKESAPFRIALNR